MWGVVVCCGWCVVVCVFCVCFILYLIFIQHFSSYFIHPRAGSYRRLLMELFGDSMFDPEKDAKVGLKFTSYAIFFLRLTFFLSFFIFSLAETPRCHERSR